MPSIYVASLSDYVAGRLHGEWIDLDGMDVDQVHQAAKAMIDDSLNEAYGDGPAEEWAIHDYEGFGEYRVSEYESLETVVTVAAAIAEHGEAVAAWIEHCGGSYAHNAIDTFQDAHHGTWQSGKEFAEEFTIETWGGSGDPSDNPFWSYIDWDRYWHGEFECDGWFITSEGHVFNGNV